MRWVRSALACTMQADRLLSRCKPVQLLLLAVAMTAVQVSVPSM